MQRTIQRARVLVRLCAATTVALAGGASASGFALPEVSTAGLGTANAMVANPEETGAFAYNPAAMGFHDASSVELGAAFYGPSFKVTTSSGVHHGGGSDWLGVPQAQVAIKAAEQWRIGLGVSAPFGLETRWPLGTFPALNQTATLPLPSGPVSVPTGNSPTQSKVEILDFVPTAVYRANDNLSLGAGLDIYWAKTAELNSNLGKLNGDGSGLGFNLSAMYRQDAWSVGAVFRSQATLDIDGMYTPQNMTLVALNSFLTSIGSRGLQPAQTASVELDLPWRLQLGFRYEVTEALAVELDYWRTGWSSFETLEVIGDNAGAVIFADTNDWEDSNAYRVGATYQVRPETQLRVGYAYDETGQPDDHFSARVPDNDRQLFSIGLAQSLGDGYSLEGAYTYAAANERKFRGATPYEGGADVNGTTALNGDYESSAHVVGFSLVKVF